MAAKPNHLIAEKRLEEAACAHARRIGFEVYKFTSPGRRGVPDRMFINPRGRICFIEFKAPLQSPGPLQKRELKILQERGVQVIWSNRLLECTEFLDAFVET